MIDFTIEDRSGVRVIVYPLGCQPATSAEAALWDELVRLRADRLERMVAAVATGYYADGTPCLETGRQPRVKAIVAEARALLAELDKSQEQV